MRNKFFLQIVLILFVLTSVGAQAQLTMLDLSSKKMGQHLYLLPQPLENPITLGIGGEVLIYGEYVRKIVTAGLIAGHMTGYNHWAILGGGLVQAGLGAIDLSPSSFLVLRIKQAYQWRGKVASLDTIPGATEARLIVTSAYQLQGPTITGMHRQAYVFVTTDQDISNDPEVINQFGKPIELTDLSTASLELTLNIDGKANPQTWRISLSDAFSGKKIPPEMAAPWREQLQAFESQRTIWDRYMTHKNDFLPHVSASLLIAGQQPVEVGDAFIGKDVNALLGLTIPRKAARLFTWEHNYLDGKLTAKNKAIACNAYLGGLLGAL